MKYATTAALIISLASIVVAPGIDALTPGAAGAAVEAPKQTSTTAAPERREPADETRRTSIYAETREQYLTVTWALERFEQAGLELPPVTIYVHSDMQQCNGLAGFHSKNEAGEQEIHNCGLLFTLLHELAHAWDHHQLDDATRDKFLVIADADTWESDEWSLSGNEHAANVLAWGLMDRRINVSRTGPYDYKSMLEAYGALTADAEPLWMVG